MARQATPRRIRRYANRKLYDVEARRYVTLEELGAFVARGHEIEVTDQKTGEDTTGLTLAQCLLEGLKERTARIPRQVLVRLVRLGARPASAWAGWVGPQEAAARAREEVERIVGGLLARGRLTLEEAMSLRQEVAGSVHGIVAQAQSGLEDRIRGLFEAIGPRRGRSPRGSGRTKRKTRHRAARGPSRRRTA